MSKVIEPAPFLSEFDRQYLIDRGKDPDDYLVPVTEENANEVPPYTEWKVSELQAEVERRNKEYADSVEDGEDPVVIEVEAPGNKPELIAALEADDEAADDSDDEDAS